MRTRRRPNGLSIIEVLISFTVLAVAILALLGVLPAAGRQGMSTDIQNQALFIAQQRMDEILAAGNTIPPSRPPYNPLPDNPELNMQVLESGEDLPQGFGAVQKVTIEITWLEQGRARQVRLVSAVAASED